MNNIILEDKDKNIILGNISVINKDELREFRDGLIRIGYEEKVSERCTFKDLFMSGFFPNYSNGSLVKKNYKYSDGNVVFYNNVEIKNKYMNSILLFSSLLDEINIENYDEIITKLFIESGIMKSNSFKETWDNCSRNLLQLDSNHPDFQAFKFAFDDGLIHFDVISRLSSFECISKNVFKGMTLNELQQIGNNSKLFNKMCEKQRKNDYRKTLKK